MDNPQTRVPMLWMKLQTLMLILTTKEIEFLIIASIETLKRQNKKCGKDEVFALVKDSLEEAITWKEKKNL